MSSLLPIRRLFGPSIALAALISALQVAAPNYAQGTPIGMAAHLTAFQSGPAPQGFHGICSRYRWACRNGGAANAHPDSLQLAAQVNARVNREIRAATDAINYGVPERWTLPYNGRGDCEDIALLKMKRLIEAGVPSSSLLLAVVAGPMPEPHVVLVLRTTTGDYVLDNLSSRIKTWQASRYTFLRMQNPANRSKWDVILLGPRAVRR
jgi:predicted transglutaminase-like cysteine proteinase